MGTLVTAVFSCGVMFDGKILIFPSWISRANLVAQGQKVYA